MLILGLVVSAAVLYIAKDKGQAGVPVKTAVVEAKPIQDNVFASGRVRLCAKQELYSFTGTTVQELKVSPGDRVSKGQVLGLLNADEIEDDYNEAKASFIAQEANLNKSIYPREEEIAQERANYRRAEADYRNAQKNYERKKLLYEQGALNAKEFDDAELDLAGREAEFKIAGEKLKMKESGPAGHELTALKAQIEQARYRFEQEENKLNKTVLRAEMDGIVTAVEVALGDYVQPGTRLITIGDTGLLEVTGGVSEGDSGKLKPGQKVKVTTAAQPGREYSGILQSVSPGAVESKTAERGSQIEVPVIIKIEGDPEGLRPGYTVDLSITAVDRDMTLVVPYEAVVEIEGAKKVFVVENQVARLKDVIIGVDTALSTEILSGLSEGEIVVISPGKELLDGSRVKEMTGNSPVKGEANAT
ncbi:MAG: efflux RND transporter periplasmic adaptor subunit [Desulfotomaculaceae bacterium]|nr:efflux RND transporter periplasmic adaptor subunit [Desulfotomaculaceae bacterium]